MIALTADQLNMLLGWAALPLLLIAFTSHIKRAIACLPFTMDRRNATVWPLVLDVCAIVAVHLMRRDGRLDIPGVVGFSTVVLLGLVLGMITGKLYDAYESATNPVREVNKEGAPVPTSP